ncbi:MAG: hypothetical protein QOC86_2408 [Gaiellales bacterium]|jgi:hypothetical protein|nr:hypothetical protein [Gaiellales bacterium]
MRIIVLVSVLLLVPAVPVAGAAIARDAIVHPTSADAVVLRVTTGGGFVAPQTNLRLLPSFTLYGDGTVIVPGVVRQIFPGPAISPLLRRHLSESRMQALLRRARAAGLLAGGPVDYGDMSAVGISDAPTTTLLLNAAGRHVTRSAYALGAGRGGGRMSPRQMRARAALAHFVAALPSGPGGSPYAPRAIAVYVAPATGQPPAGAGRVAWPLKRDLATAGTKVSNGLGYRCIAVRGKDATTLLARLRAADERSRWFVRGRRGRTYEVIARPLLPDEPGCSAATP